MKNLRKPLGIFVMIAGMIGLLLSLTGLVGILMVRPGIQEASKTTLDTVYTSIDSSQQVIRVTGETLSATYDTVETLSSMLATTAQSLDDTQLILDQVNHVTGKQLPEALEAAHTSLKAAEQSAKSLDTAIKSFETFTSIIASTPLFGSLVPKDNQPYDPDKTLAESLGDLAVSLEDMPDTFIEMAKNMKNADDNLVKIQTDLKSMAENVGEIADGLKEYNDMVIDSQSSMEELKTLVSNLRENQAKILNTMSITFALFFLWLLAAQVVIFSQGWELYHGEIASAGVKSDGNEEETESAESAVQD